MMKQTLTWLGCIILLVTLCVPVVSQDDGAEDLMTLDEGDMNSILDELIGSMGGETAPEPVMEAQPEPVQPPEDTMMQAQQPVEEAAPIEATPPVEEAPPMEEVAVMDAAPMDGGTGEFGMGADDITNMGAAVEAADGEAQALPDGFEPIGEVAEGTPPGEFGMGADPIDQQAMDTSMEDVPEPMNTEPAPESLIEGGDYAQSEVPMDSTPMEEAPLDEAPLDGEQFDSAQVDSAPMDSEPLAQSTYEEPPTPADMGGQSVDYGEPADMGAMASTPIDYGAAKEPTAEEIRNRSVIIAKEEDEQLLITVGDKVYMPIPAFKTPQVKDYYTIYKGSKKKLFRRQPNTTWYKKIGKLKVVEVSNLYVLGVVMAANDVIQQGDVVYIRP